MTKTAKGQGKAVIFSRNCSGIAGKAVKVDDKFSLFRQLQAGLLAAAPFSIFSR